jgi:hypothetical protein
MPQIDWTPEFKRNAGITFDRMKLKVGERARIVTLEKPTFTWVHTMRAPKIVNGEASKVIKKRKDGTEFVDWDMDFVGRPQCLGDHGIIADEGLDPKNCVICAGAKESEEFSAPERRFAMNVIKYNTKQDGTLIEPFGCASQVWTFTEGIFNKLYGIAQEQNGLVGKDLILGPCEAPEAFQKFDIQPGAKNVWQMSDQITTFVTETHKNNRTEELEAACGRRTELKWLKDDVDKVKTRWRIANGDTSALGGSEKHDVEALKGELDNLLAPPTPPAKAASAKPAADEEQQRESTGGEPNDFSALLANLNL